MGPRKDRFEQKKEQLRDETLAGRRHRILQQQQKQGRRSLSSSSTDHARRMFTWVMSLTFLSGVMLVLPLHQHVMKDSFILSSTIATTKAIQDQYQSLYANYYVDGSTTGGGRGGAPSSTTITDTFWSATRRDLKDLTGIDLNNATTSFTDGANTVLSSISSLISSTESTAESPSSSSSSRSLFLSTSPSSVISFPDHDLDNIVFPPINRTIPSNETFGSCILMRSDNDFLIEFLAYHYVTLPLRYIYILSDTTNDEDPEDILKRWKIANTDLQYKVVNVSHVDVGVVGPEPPIDSKAHTTQIVYKQRLLLHNCIKYMKTHNVGYVTTTDTDEFIMINHLTDQQKQLQHQNETLFHSRFGDNREQIPPKESHPTVVDVLNILGDHVTPCVKIPRLNFGSLQNRHCPKSATVRDFVARNFENFNSSSWKVGSPMWATLKYQEHNIPDGSETSGAAKTILDISSGRIRDRILYKDVPRDVHRPFTKVCSQPFASIARAPFVGMHFAGPYERLLRSSSSSSNNTVGNGTDANTTITTISTRPQRAGYDRWKQRGHASKSIECCDHETHRWLPQFIEQVGLDRAKFLMR